MNDPIVEEVRRVREAHAARFNYDLDAIFQDIKEQEKKSGHKFVAGASRRAEPEAAADLRRHAACGVTRTERRLPRTTDY